MTVSGYAKDDVLVSADWAKAHLDDPTIRFVEVDVDTTAYDQSHIPGAVGWNWTSQLSDGVRRDIASREDFSELLSKSGIGPDTTIVLYGDNNNWFAAWAYWQLLLYGHTNVAPAQRRPQVLARQQPAAVDGRSGVPGVRVPAPRGRLRRCARSATTSCRASATTRSQLVDVRSPAEFNGEVIAPPGMTETAQRAGHIPGAASIPWAQQVREDGTFKSAEELTALYEAKGITRGPRHDRVLPDRRAVVALVVRPARAARLQRVRNYDGSWTEWGSMVGVPIEVNQPVAVG